MKNLDLKQALCEAIELNKTEVIERGYDLFRHPELGFKEFYTNNIMVTALNEIGAAVSSPLSRTGIKGTLGKAGIHIGLIAEMDAIPTEGHPLSSADQHAAHACAHANQVAIMLAVAEALNASQLLEQTGGRISVIGTPAEEFTDLAFRESIREKGEINYLSGKQDMITKGAFDDIDLIISCHTMGGVAGHKADVNAKLNGFISKKVTYIGEAAHAGAEPHKGINALNAAMIGISAINALRETFMEAYKIRVHAIIKEGGETVNSIPSRVVLEAMVRGSELDALLMVNEKVNRAFKAGAYAVGGECVIEDQPGFLPFEQCEALSSVLKQNMATLIGIDNIIDGFQSTASGDIGDVSMLLPTIQFGFSGFAGRVHGADFKITDDDMAFIIPAKAIAMTICDLLENEGKLAKEIVQDFKPTYTKDSYESNWLKFNI